jgi:heptosyltransferase-2
VIPASPVDRTPGPPPRILVCGVNWLGDAILSMPALQAFRWENPDADLTLLVRPALAPLWAMHAAPTRVLALPADAAGLRPLARSLRERGIETAYVLPHSFRSALPPWLARIPSRIGLPGHFPRDLLLTDVRPPARGPGREHQVYEYLDLFFPAPPAAPFRPPPCPFPRPSSSACTKHSTPCPAPGSP